MEYESECDSDIDILEDLSQHNSSGNNNIIVVDDSNGSDEIQFLGAVDGNDIQVLEQIYPKHDNSDIEIVDEIRGDSAAQTSSQSENKLPQTVSQKCIKELIKTQLITIDDDNDEFGGSSVKNDFDNNVAVKTGDITPTEIIDGKSNVDDGSSGNDNRVNDNSVASIVEKCDHMSIETSDQTVDKDIEVVVGVTEEGDTSNIRELVTDLNLKDDNNDKNISAVIEDNNNTSAPPVLNETNDTLLGSDLDTDTEISGASNETTSAIIDANNIACAPRVLHIDLNSINEDVDSGLIFNASDVSYQSYQVTVAVDVDVDDDKDSIASSSNSAANQCAITATIPNQKSSIDSTGSISVDNASSHSKKSPIPSDLRPKPKCKKKKAEDRYECLKCSFVTYNLVNLIYHNSEHRNTFKCKHQLCSYQTNTKDKLERHFTKHDSMRKMCLPCMKQTMLCDCGECDQSRTSVVEQLAT